MSHDQEPPRPPYGQQPSGPGRQPQYPPQQQPWPPYGQQQPYGQAPPPPQWQQPYAPPQQAGPPPGRRRKRHTLRTVLISGAGLVVAIIVISALAASGNHTITTGQTSSTTTAPSAPASSAAAAKHAGVGSTITLSGFNGGEQMAVTVVKVYSHAQPASEFDGPDPGDRLYAVQFRLRDTGGAAYSDAPSNGAGVTDAKGQSYQSWYGNAAECQSFPGTENIAPGASGLGCVVFEVPESAVITEVQFTLDSGMGPQTGQWELRR